MCRIEVEQESELCVQKLDLTRPTGRVLSRENLSSRPYDSHIQCKIIYLVYAGSRKIVKEIFGHIDHCKVDTIFVAVKKFMEAETIRKHTSEEQTSA